MKHIKRITTNKADVWSDIVDWFQSLWEVIADYAKDTPTPIS